MQDENSEFQIQDPNNVSPVKVILGRVKYYLSAAEPTIVNILNATIYYTLKFVKNVVTITFRMIMGKEV